MVPKSAFASCSGAVSVPVEAIQLVLKNAFSSAPRAARRCSWRDRGGISWCFRYAFSFAQWSR